MILQRSSNAHVFDRVESLLEVGGGYPRALLPFVCFLSHLVGRGVLWFEVCLVRRLVPVQCWLESVEKYFAEEFVQYRDGASWSTVGGERGVAVIVDDRDGCVTPARLGAV